MSLPERPLGKYDHTKQDDPAWQRYVWHLARWNLLQLREIAALLGIPKKTLDNHDLILSVIRSGWSEAYGAVNFELLSIAATDPSMYDDPAERAQIRAQKLDALKTVSKIYEKRTEYEMLSADKDKDREALKSMSIEELKARAQELLK